MSSDPARWCSTNETEECFLILARLTVWTKPLRCTLLRAPGKEHDCNESFVRQRFPDFDIRRNYLILITNVHDRDRYFELPGHIGLVFVRRQEIHGEKLKVPIRTRSLPDNIIKQLLETIDRNPVVLGQQSMHSQLYELLAFSEPEKIFSLAIRDWPDLQRAFDLVAANSST